MLISFIQINTTKANSTQIVFKHITFYIKDVGRRKKKKKTPAT